MFSFNHFNFNVSDLDKSLAFYREALGLTEVRRTVAEDGSFTIVFLGDGKTGFRLELTALRDHPQKYDLGECEFHLALTKSTRPWAACAMKTPPWASTSSPIRMGTGSRSCPKSEPGQRKSRGRKSSAFFITRPGWRSSRPGSLPGGSGPQSRPAAAAALPSGACRCSYSPWSGRGRRCRG